MKGPSLHYDLRVLRVFACDACGRQVQTPGHVTSQVCQCSDPPKFMRPLERPATVSPDVSRFISAPDADELLEVEEIDETPYIPHVPLKPPPPPRFANRRKLYEDTDGGGQSDFGDGILQESKGEFDSENDASEPEILKPEVKRNPRRDPDPAKASQPVENTERDRNRSRRRRGRSGPSDSGGSSRNAPTTPASRPDVGHSGSGRATPQISDNAPVSDGVPPAQRHPEVDQNEKDIEAETAGSGAPRRSRRRGRRRGPRPEGGHA
jgi:hypothetical protein